MTVLRHPTPLPDRPVVELHNVSRSFQKHRDLERSLQQRLLNLFTRRRPVVDEFYPLKDVSLQINKGDFLGVLGPNGAGKSTLLKLITGIIPPTKGDMVVNGRVCSLLELGAGFHPDLTGRENVYLNGSIYGLNRREIDARIEQIIDFAELGDFIDTPVKHYSSGMYVRLGFAVAIHTDPDILLVDEVLAVGDVNFQQKCLRSIEHFRDEGGTLILVSHDLSTIQTYCNRAVWLEGGHILEDGNPLDVGMAYLEAMARKEAAYATGVASDEGSRRWGTGRIQIRAVQLHDSNGQERDYFYTGESVAIRLLYHAQDVVPEPVFGLAIHHQNGAHIAGPNTDFGGMELANVQGDGFVDYLVPGLPLLEGVYNVSVAVINHANTETYDFRYRICQFRVLAGTSTERYGLITLGGYWRSSTPSTATTQEPTAEKTLSNVASYP